jgi:protein involved in polysaccharide export with SLBB domain
MVFGIILLTAGASAPAQEAAAPQLAVINTNKSLSGSQGVRAEWQKRLTLGPGDTVAISVLDNADSHRSVLVGPDGRINYLEVEDFVVTGLTIDELRAQLDEKLGRFYVSPRTIVIPNTFSSKKYVMLGAVRQRGVFVLNRPTTVVEAVARSGGLDSGLINDNPSEMADLTHSFLIRNGKRLPVDFEKLFLDGDLTHNVPLEPEDYLVFTPADQNEIYVLGEVNGPGPQTWGPVTTVISAITRGGSFTEAAYRQKVLIVRGSLNSPETIVVDTKAILDGRRPDFKLETGDIVYVNRKPWQTAKELLEGATAAFVQAAVITYAGRHIGPFIKEPVIE